MSFNFCYSISGTCLGSDLSWKLCYDVGVYLKIGRRFIPREEGDMNLMEKSYKRIMVDL